MVDVIAFDPTVIRPALQQVRLREIKANSSFAGGRREVDLKLNRGVDVELRQISDGDVVHAAVVISLGAIAFEGDESKPLATVEAVYEGDFAFPEGVTFDEVKEPMGQRGYQRELVLQAFPVAISFFRDALATMGLLAGVMPLTPP